MKKQPFDLKVAGIRWLMGMLIGLATQLLSQLNAGVTLAHINWDATLTPVIVGFLTALVVDLGAWKNWPPPSEE